MFKLSQIVEDYDNILDSLNLKRDVIFSSYSDLLESQKEANLQIIEVVRNNISITFECNDSLKKLLWKVINIWKPSIEWNITSFFHSIDRTYSLKDKNRDLQPKFELRLLTTEMDLRNQVSELGIIVKNFLSSVLVRCSDLDLVKDIYSSICKNSSDNITNRFFDFIAEQFETDAQQFLSGSIAHSHKNSIIDEANPLFSEDVLLRIKDILISEKSFSNRSKLSSYKNSCKNDIIGIIEHEIIEPAFKEVNVSNRLVNVLSPQILWDYNIELCGLNTETSFGDEILITYPKYTLMARTSAEELSNYISGFVKTILDLKPKYFSVNGEKQFLRDLYSQIYIYLDIESKRLLERILCSKCNVSFIDYSDEYIEDDYFEFLIVDKPELVGQKNRALVSEIDGECLGKGLYKKYNKHGKESSNF